MSTYTINPDTIWETFKAKIDRFELTAEVVPMVEAAETIESQKAALQPRITAAREKADSLRRPLDAPMRAAGLSPREVDERNRQRELHRAAVGELRPLEEKLFNLQRDLRDLQQRIALSLTGSSGG